MKKRQYHLHLLLIVAGIVAVFVLASANGAYNLFSSSVDAEVVEGKDSSSGVQTDEDTVISRGFQVASGSVFMNGDKEYETVTDEQYTYYLDENGIPVHIAPKDIITKDITTLKSDSFGKEEAVKKAEALFDQVFPDAVKVKGREKESVVTAGQTWLVTIHLLENGYDTGYAACIDYSLDGQLIGSAFIPGEEERPEILITEEQSFQLAQEALLTYCRKNYGDNTMLHFEETRNISCVYRIARGNHFWRIEFGVPIENIGYRNDEVLFSIIKIDSQTGECLEIATSLVGGFK